MPPERDGPERGRTVLDSVSSSVDALRSRAIDRVRKWRADRAFSHRELPSATPTPDGPDHVVCVTVDALRADTVGPEHTPFLDALSPARAVSPSTWTFPAVTSLVTGLYPHEHGAIRQADTYENSVADMTPLPPALDEGTLTLPEELAGAGYETFGGFGMLVPFLALSGRFETHRLCADGDAERVLAEHGSWLADREEQRTFSYLHLSDLHEPVDPPAEYWSSHDVDESIPGIRRWRHEDVPRLSPTGERYRRHRKRLYEAAAEYVDERLSAHYARLTDRLDDVVFVVTGDHGEGFWERAPFHEAHFADPRPAYCVGHGGAPYEPITRVPLAFAASGSRTVPRTGDLDARVSLVDVAPTVREMVGLDDPRSGKPTEPGSKPTGATSLLDAVPERQLLVEGMRYGYEKKAVYDGDRKLIVSRGDNVSAGFSLPDGNSLELPQSDEESLREALPAWPQGDTGTVQRPESNDVRRRLDALGYT